MWAPIDAQRAGAFMGSSDDPAIKYSTAPLNNAVVDVNKKLQDGAVQLTFEGRSGFLRSALEALQIPVDSQLLVFSRASLQGQADQRTESPRAVLQRSRRARLGARRRRHRSRRSRRVRRRRVLHARTACRRDDRPAAVQAGLRVPGVSHGGRYARRARPADVQHHTPGSIPRLPAFRATSITAIALRRRFGGWFVTGSTGSAPHMGNDVGRARRTCQSRARRRSRGCSTRMAIARSRATSSPTWCSPTRPA